MPAEAKHTGCNEVGGETCVLSAVSIVSDRCLPLPAFGEALDFLPRGILSRSYGVKVAFHVKYGVYAKTIENPISTLLLEV